jgi:hypothetical protein
MLNNRRRPAAVRAAFALSVVLTGIAVSLPAQALAAPAAGGDWAATGVLFEGHSFAAMAVLPTGDVLLAGGKGSFGDPGPPLASSEIYDPSTGAWSASAELLEPRDFATAAPLPDGTVLVAGGHNASGYLASTEIYNPFTNTWSAGNPMLEAREGASAVSLPDGDVLVVGGENAGHEYLASTEIYDPLTEGWTAATPMKEPREREIAVSLPDGNVLVAGGENESGYLGSSEIYDPLSETWSAASPMGEPREGATAALLPNGNVLVVGGENENGDLESTEIYDPLTETWTPATPMNQAREGASAASLPNGTVLVAGGFDGPTLETSELFYSTPQAAVAGGDFGGQTVAQPSPVSVLSVTNIGAQQLSITGATLEGANSGDFAIVANACSGRRLAFAQSCTITARFTPGATGARSAQLALADNEPAPVAIALSGTGVEANSGPTGPAGPTGDAGPTGPAGDAGAAGPMGAAGAAGVAGPAGAAGLAGAAGPQGGPGAKGATGPKGAQGPPGKVELITCEKVKSAKTGKIVQSCQTKKGSVPAKFTGVGTKLAATLSRGKVVYATGFALSASSRTQLLLRPLRGIGRGSYTLSVKRGNGYQRETVTIK